MRRPSLEVSPFRLLLDELCAEGLYARGIQASVAVGQEGVVTSLAVGENVPGHPLTSDHLFNVWCASRPILVCTFLREAELAGIVPDQPVGSVVREVGPELAAVSWCSALCHRAGLTSPSLLEASLMPTSVAIRMALEARPTGHPGYSDFVLNVLLVKAIEALTGYSADVAIARHLEGLALTDLIKCGLDSDDLSDPLSHIGFYTYGLPGQPVPLYHDAIESVACRHRDLFGLYASAEGLARWYWSLGSAILGRDMPAMPSRSELDRWLSCRRGDQFDYVLQRECDFACGLMVNLHGHAFGDDVGSSSVGHSGVMGSPFGFFDPDRNLAAAVIVNGLQPGQTDLDYLRPLLVKGVVEWAAHMRDE